MDSDIASAADTLALQRIQAQDYRNAVTAAAEQHTATVARETARDALAQTDREATAAWREANLSLTERHIAVAERQEALLASPSQERWMELYRMHLSIRLGPAIITSTTPSSVILDMVNDATQMTVTAWPQVKAELDKLA